MFSDISVSQGSVATYAGNGGIFNDRLTANFFEVSSSEKIVNRLKFDRIMDMSLASLFVPPCICNFTAAYVTDISKLLSVVPCISSPPAARTPFRARYTDRLNPENNIVVVSSFSSVVARSTGQPRSYL